MFLSSSIEKNKPEKKIKEFIKKRKRTEINSDNENSEKENSKWEKSIKNKNGAIEQNIQNVKMKAE